MGRNNWWLRNRNGSRWPARWHRSCGPPRRVEMKWWRRKRLEEELERELRSDLELEAAEQQENGLSPDEALRAARRAFGNTTLVQEEVRETGGRMSLERLGHDLRYSIRTLRKSPAF